MMTAVDAAAAAAAWVRDVVQRGQRMHRERDLLFAMMQFLQQVMNDVMS